MMNQMVSQQTKYQVIFTMVSFNVQRILRLCSEIIVYLPQVMDSFQSIQDEPCDNILRPTEVVIT